MKRLRDKIDAMPERRLYLRIETFQPPPEGGVRYGPGLSVELGPCGEIMPAALEAAACVAKMELARWLRTWAHRRA